MATEKMADDFESLIKDIACAHRIPHAAMAQAMAHAGALFPRIEALAKRRIAGEWLYPAEENLLLAGLCVLAAAKERAIWPVWLDLITLPDADLEECLGEDCVQTIAAVTLGLVDADVGAIAALVSERRTDADACCALVSVLARLMCEGRYERGAFVEMIDGLAALAHEDKDAFAAPNLEQAILLGGIAERADLLEQIWQADTEGFWREVDRIDARKRLKAAAANPADLRRFDEEGVAAPREPGEAMRWLSRADARRAPERPEAAPLSWREREAFAAFLTRAGVMTFEELDGFVHSLVLGPDLVAPSECFPRIWGKDEPVFEDTDDADRILALLQRHWNSVVQCGLDGDRPRPWLEAQPAFKPGQVWARGFLTGVMMRDALWDAAGEESGAALGLAAILRLGGDEIDEEERRDRLYDLPYDIAGIDRYWRELREEEMRAERAPVRVEKVGRNAPCPCGSGKKWKKCCGAGETAH